MAEPEISAEHPVYTGAIALAGVGVLGNVVGRELLSRGFIPRIFTRSIANNPNLAQLAKLGAIIYEIDYTKEEALAVALQNVDVVCCFFKGQDKFISQETLARQSKAMGVQLFIPSDFAGDDFTVSHPAVQQSVMFRRYLEGIGLPWLSIATGVHASYVYRFLPSRVLNFEDKKASFVGSGRTLFSVSSERDIAKFLVCAITQRPLETLHNSILRVESIRTSWRQVLEASGGPEGWTIEHRLCRELQDGVIPPEVTGIDWVLARIETGQTILKSVDNELILGPNFRSISQIGLLTHYNKEVVT